MVRGLANTTRKTMICSFLYLTGSRVVLETKVWPEALCLFWIETVNLFKQELPDEYALNEKKDLEINRD